MFIGIQAGVRVLQSIDGEGFIKYQKPRLLWLLVIPQFATVFNCVSTSIGWRYT